MRDISRERCGAAPASPTLAPVDRDRAAATLAAALGVGLVAQYLFVREAIGVNLLAATLVTLAVAWRVARRRPRDIWAPAGALVFAGLCAVRTDVPLVAFDLIAALTLLAASALAFRGVRVWDLPLIALANVAFALSEALLLAAASIARVGAPAARGLVPTRGSRAIASASGVALAVPLVVVFGALFASADAVFRHLVENAIDLPELRRLLGELPVRLALAAVVAWLCAGWLASFDRAAPAPAAAPKGRLAADAATAMVLTLDALFALFVVVQIAYLFGGRDTLDAAGVAYSEYGRAGFFELVAVAAMVATLLFTLDLVVSRRSVRYVLAAVTLVMLTGVVLASAWLRMDLYQRAYGWSELRFYAFAGIAYTGVALALLALAIARGSMQVTLQRLAFAGLLMAFAVNVMAPSDFVARRNFERVIDPSSLPEDASRGLDVAYLVWLGEGAVPVTFELLPSLPEPEASAVREALRVATTRRAPLAGWQSWNLDRERARSVIVRAGGGAIGLR